MHEMSWQAPAVEGVVGTAGALRIEIVSLPVATLVTGALDAVLAHLPDARMAGYVPEGEAPEVLRIAADKALALAGELPEGWHPDGFAASRCTGAWTAIDLSGPAAREAMQMATALDLDAPSPSAATMLNGQAGGLLARQGTGWRLVVPAPLVSFHATALSHIAASLAGP